MAENTGDTPRQGGPRPRGPRRQEGRASQQPQSVSDVRNEVVRDVQQAERASASTRDERKRSIAEKIKDLFKKKKIEASEIREHIKEQGTKGIENNNRWKARGVKLEMAKLFEGVKQGVIDVPSDRNRTLLLKLDERIGQSLSDESASPLYPLVDRLISADDITLEDLQQEFDELKLQMNQFTLEEISQAIVETAQTGAFGIDASRARELFHAESKFPPTRSKKEKDEKIKEKSKSNIEDENETDEESTVEVWKKRFDERYLPENYPAMMGNLSDDEHELLYALHEPFLLKGYVDKLTKYFEENPKPGFTTEMAASDKLERNIVLLFERLYARIDTQRPNKFWDEIEQEDLMKSIQSAKSRLIRELENMANRLRQPEYKELFGNNYYIREEDKQYAVKDFTLENGEELHSVIQVVRRPTPLAKETDIANFLTRVKEVVDTNLTVRSYLHNVSVLLRRQPQGEGGFWGGLAGYAEQFRSLDFDSLTRLPDSDIYFDANRLYQKHLREMFSISDWIHNPSMFTEEIDSRYTAVESDVQNELIKLHPELGEPLERFRLLRAMNMGIGISKGAYMNLIETAAWADPDMIVTPDSPNATFRSYFYSDAAALAPLNPRHQFLRWQSEGVIKGPLIYLLTEGFDRKHTRKWDHRFIWQKAEEFKKSYTTGSRAIHKDNPNEKIFIDQMANFGGVGGVFTRAGWRSFAALEGWMHKNDDGSIKILDSWKALENIGYEALNSFISVGETGFGKFLQKDSPDRTKFFRYIYGKYIREDGTGFEEFVKNEHELAKQNFDENHKHQLANYAIDTHHKEKQTLADAGYMITTRALAGLLKQRAPSIMMTIERNREMADGTRSWEALRKQVFHTGDHDKSIKLMDNAMKDIMLVETQLRSETSELMHQHLRAQPSDAKDLSTFHTESYQLTEDSLKSHLEKIYKDHPDMSERVANATKLFNAMADRMDNEYLNQFGERIRKKNFPFALAVDELDTSFYALSNAGERPVARAIGDTAKVETVVYKNMTELMHHLHKIATDPKHDFGAIINHISAAKHEIESIHGHAKATKVAHDMAAMAITYFRKDRNAENIYRKGISVLLGKYFKEPHSLASRFTSVNRGCWEWETKDVDTFITLLEQHDVLRRKAIDIGKPEFKSKNRLFRMLGVKYEVDFELEYDYSGDRLRKEFGATKWDVARSLMSKYLPFAVAAMLYSAIMKALKENKEKH